MRRATNIVVGLSLAGALALGACGDGGGGAAGGSQADFCAELRSLGETGSFDDADFEDASGMEEGMREAQAAVASLAERAPSEIRDDVNTLQKGFDDFVGLMAEYDYDIVQVMTAAQADPALADRLEAFDSAEFQQAADNLERYGEEVCGIEPGADG
jgi:hypothetical protein